MPEFVSREDPRSKRTRKYLQQAFLELLTDKDFQTMTINDITERAGLNRATFYGHFQDKFELLDETLGFMLEETIRKWVSPAPKMDETSLVRQLLLAICEWLSETSLQINRKHSLSAALEENTTRKLYSILIPCLSELENGHSQDRRKTEIKAAMISCSIYGVVLQWSKQSEKENPELLVDKVLPLIIACIKA